MNALSGNNNDIEHNDSTNNSTSTIINLSSDSQINDSCRKINMLSLSKPSNASGESELWCKNKENLNVTLENLKSQSNLFNSTL